MPTRYAGCNASAASDRAFDPAAWGLRREGRTSEVFLFIGHWLGVLSTFIL